MGGRVCWLAWVAAEPGWPSEGCLAVAQPPAGADRRGGPESGKPAEHHRLEHRRDSVKTSARKVRKKLTSEFWVPSFTLGDCQQTEQRSEVRPAAKVV